MPRESKFFMRQNRMNLIALKSFYTHTVDVLKDKRVPENIFVGRRIPKTIHPVKKDFLEMKFLKVIFENEFANNIEKGFADNHVFRALKFCALTGMRSAEVRALKFNQFDTACKNILNINQAFKANTIKKHDIGKPKWDKTRSIYICDSALETVGEVGYSRYNFVFASNTGNPISASHFISMMKRYLRMIDIFYYENYGEYFFGENTYTPHSLRGGLNSYLLSTGELGTHLIQHYFGWTKKSLTTVQEKHYTKISPIETFKVAKAIEKGFSGRIMEDPEVWIDTSMEDNLDKLKQLKKIERKSVYVPEMKFKL